MFHFQSADRLFLIPPCFAFGIIFSFLWSHWILLGIILICFIVFLYSFWVKKYPILQLIIISILIGQAIGFRYYHIYYETNPLEKTISDITVSGQIITIQDDATKPRIILKIDNHLEQKLPVFVRLNISETDYQILHPYDMITANIFLIPPAKPLFKGAYNFAFYAQLHGFGATGHLKKIILHKHSEKNLLSQYIHLIRLKIGQNIHKILPNETASPIVAMITGARFNMPNTIEQAWKASGIYHLLSISGLHMTIVAGICFFVIRRLLLCIPALAHGAYIKKITAFCVIPLAYGYVLLSGSNVPVMRAYIMVCVGLVALLCNQRMITLRSACVAFCLVLLINPVDIFNIGFALSFAAVFGIIIATHLIDNLKQKFSVSKIFQFMIINSFAGYVGLPLAIYIFHTNALLGLLSNMIAVPLTSFLLMPLICITVFLITFNIHGYPLIMSGWGIDFLNQLSLWIADFPYAVLYQQAPLLIWIILFYVGIYALALNKDYFVKFGMALIGIAFLGHILTPKQDFLHIPKQNTVFFINENNDLIRLVTYDKSYFNPYIKEQILLYFGYNPNADFFYEKSNCYKIFRTKSGGKFKYCNNKIS